MQALKNANVRAGPSTADAKVGALNKGSAVNVTGEVEGRAWYRVALADGGEGYVWRPLLGEETDAPEAASGDVPEEKAAKVQPSNPSEIVIASGPLQGLTLADWLLLSADRLKQGEFASLIGETVELRERHGRMPDVEQVLQQAVLGDLGSKEGMAQVVYAAAYRRQHGAFGALDSFLDEAVKERISELGPVTRINAVAKLARIIHGTA